MGELFRVSLDYAGDRGELPRSLIVKLPSPYPETAPRVSPSGCTRARFRFYNDLAGSTAARSPRCYHASIESHTGDFVIVVEDLSAMDVADEVAGISRPPGASALSKRSPVCTRRRGGRMDGPEHDWIPSMWAPRIQQFAEMLPTLWQGFVAKLGHVLPPGARRQAT